MFIAFSRSGPPQGPVRAVDEQNWSVAGAKLNTIRQIIAINLPFGLIVVVIGASGRYWGYSDLNRCIEPYGR